MNLSFESLLSARWGNTIGRTYPNDNINHVNVYLEGVGDGDDGSKSKLSTAGLVQIKKGPFQLFFWGKVIEESKARLQKREVTVPANSAISNCR